MSALTKELNCCFNVEGEKKTRVQPTKFIYMNDGINCILKYVIINKTLAVLVLSYGEAELSALPF